MRRRENLPFVAHHRNSLEGTEYSKPQQRPRGDCRVPVLWPVESPAGSRLTVQRCAGAAMKSDCPRKRPARPALRQNRAKHPMPCQAGAGIAQAAPPLARARSSRRGNPPGPDSIGDSVQGGRGPYPPWRAPRIQRVQRLSPRRHHGLPLPARTPPGTESGSRHLRSHRLRPARAGTGSRIPTTQRKKPTSAR